MDLVALPVPMTWLAISSPQEASASLLRVQAEATRLADTAALFMALGGGWWNRN